MKPNWNFARELGVLLAALLLAGGALRANGEVRWHADQETLDVNLDGAPLVETLGQIAKQTGWHIYLEPTPGKTFTTHFNGLARGEAMRILLGDLNYAFVPQTDAATKLFVFRTTRDAATLEIQPAAAEPVIHATKHAPTQLIVRLKPGASIEALARKLGAKVKARIGDLNAYLLEFDDAAAMETARTELAGNPDVDSTDYNYFVDQPPSAQRLAGTSVGPVQLKLNPPPADGRVVVGLIDTALQSLGPELQQFLLQQISVAGEAKPSSEPTHGTSMAETILRALQGTTAGQTRVQILPVDVYGPNPTTTTFDLASGIIRAVNGGATIINLSLGSYTDSTFLHSVITQVAGEQIPVFAAAGNDPVTTPFYPAAYPESIAVTAKASYANHGSFVDMVAPGTSVVYYNGQPWLITGTSAASAYAAGLAAGVADTRGVPTSDAASTVKNTFPFKSSF
jgi:hypothetical protein